ncbi:MULTISPECIES: hypothetical protein [Thalassospira]|uniref:SH3b domain-containing protein n=2 Tax=Thalassospira TaxID=168934 RepID=A0A367VXQ3_9PROT|nr:MULTISPECIES: hypothetical protein [Thalassospira]MDG4721558.1 hypothetical protein [Thalassospira sp. FZY0004]RCK29181.1 hypothetical protein TH19_23050 [Thalassospira profundimaris]
MKTVIAYFYVASLSLISSSAIADTVTVPPEAWKELSADLRMLDAPTLMMAAQQNPAISGSGSDTENSWTKVTTSKSSPIFTSPNSTNSIGLLEAGTPVEIKTISDGRYAITTDGFEAWVDASAFGIDFGGLAQDVMNGLIEEVARLQQKYSTSQYFVITGFSAELGISPSIAVNFEIRKTK